MSFLFVWRVILMHACSFSGFLKTTFSAYPVIHQKCQVESFLVHSITTACKEHFFNYLK